MALEGSFPATARRDNVVILGHHEGWLSGTHFLATDRISTSVIFVRLTNRSSEVYDLASIVFSVCLSWLNP